jgi:5-(carboxyamino)imidazole ribonucleotide synthase
MAERSPHLGVLGGGQLGRMLALAARPLGIEVTVVDPSPEAPAAAVARHIEAAYDDPRALTELAEADVVTFEFENVPDEAVRRLAALCPTYPSAEALRVAQDRLLEKSTFLELGIPTPRFFAVDTLADAERAFEALGPLVLKTRRFGYDGKGQARVLARGEVTTAFESLAGAPAIAEELVRFDRELSVLVCRGRSGELALYPLVQNEHRDGILVRSEAPAPAVSAALAEAAIGAASRLSTHLDYVGVLALELFVVGERIFANEFAPRVHNSGHWTLEGARTSQFENHVRAVFGLPLGSTAPVGHAVMLNLLGSVPPAAGLLAVEDAHLHDYAKRPRAGRKVGHVTVRAEQAELARARAAELAALIAAHPLPEDALPPAPSARQPGPRD